MKHPVWIWLPSNLKKCKIVIGSNYKKNNYLLMFITNYLQESINFMDCSPWPQVRNYVFIRYRLKIVCFYHLQRSFEYTKWLFMVFLYRYLNLSNVFYYISNFYLTRNVFTFEYILRTISIILSSCQYDYGEFNIYISSPSTSYLPSSWFIYVVNKPMCI